MNLRIPSGEESELIAAILAGDTELYHQLVRPYERSVYILSLSYVNNKKGAEDISQEIFIKAFRELRAFRGNSKFGAWRFRIAINEARNCLGQQTSLKLFLVMKLNEVTLLWFRLCCAIGETFPPA
jgi:RNA polymerase sigma-70 factor (ECF subfamily)